MSCDVDETVQFCVWVGAMSEHPGVLAGGSSDFDIMCRLEHSTSK